MYDSSSRPMNKARQVVQIDLFITKQFQTLWSTGETNNGCSNPSDCSDLASSARPNTEITLYQRHRRTPQSRSMLILAAKSLLISAFLLLGAMQSIQTRPVLSARSLHVSGFGSVQDEVVAYIAWTFASWSLKDHHWSNDFTH